MKYCLCLLALAVGVGQAQSTPPPSPPPGFDLKIRVVGSHKETLPRGGTQRQHLQVFLDGEALELTQADSFQGLFALGVYAGRALPPVEKHPATYEVARRYRIWFIDGTTHDFDVTALGTLTSCQAVDKP